ncbi:MAG: hypothetical protein ACFCUW_15150 [Kiloniellaceae bacterium]
MDGSEANADEEFAAMQTVYKALNPLGEDARRRVIEYIVDRLGIAPPSLATVDPSSGPTEEEGDEGSTGRPAPSRDYSSFAEIYDAAQPRSNADKALVAAYWLQVCQGTDSFEGFAVNKELKHLGHGITNITTAIDALRGQKPALVLQLKKSGKSRQARKTYKITVTGIKAVEAMIGE